jgi:glutamate formiminotransferase
VGLAPRAAFEGFPVDIPLPGVDPGRHLLEHALDYA